MSESWRQQFFATPAVAYRHLRDALKAARLETAVKDPWVLGTLVHHIERSPAASANILQHWDGQTVLVRKEAGKAHRHFAFWMRGQGWSDAVYITALLRPDPRCPPPPWAILPPPPAAPRPWSHEDHALRPETFKAATRAFLLVARRYRLDTDVVTKIVAMVAPPPVCPVLDRWRQREFGGLSPLLPPAEAEAAAAPDSESKEEGGPRGVSYWVTAARPPPVDDVEMRAKVSEFAGKLGIPPSCVSGYRREDNSITIEYSKIEFR
jgi:hypothetical protein